MSAAERPYSPACERNREPILAVLREVFADRRAVLEIGAGTGQHAVHFAAAMPWLAWHASDRPEYHDGMRAWIGHAGARNVHGPLELDVDRRPWPVPDGVDAVFSANTVHIMSWDQVERLFEGVGELLPDGAPMGLYGPFNRDGAWTSQSNRAFDAQLRRQAAHMGIRDLGDLQRLGEGAGLVLEADHAMPANNRLLIWRRGQRG